MADWGSGNYPIEACPKCKKKAGYIWTWGKNDGHSTGCLLYTSPSPRDGLLSRMPSSA